VADAAKVAQIGAANQINVRVIDAKTIGVSIDETTTLADVDALFKCVRRSLWFQLPPALLLVSGVLFVERVWVLVAWWRTSVVLCGLAGYHSQRRLHCARVMMPSVLADSLPAATTYPLTLAGCSTAARPRPSRPRPWRPPCRRAWAPTSAPPSSSRTPCSTRTTTSTTCCGGSLPGAPCQSVRPCTLVPHCSGVPA
jgi:hypothetical protein